VVGAAIVSTSDLQITPVSAGPEVNDIMVAFCVGCVYFGSFLAVPGLLGEFLITERGNRCRNLLTVMGCDFRAYWLGSFLADYVLLSVPLGALYVSWIAANMTDFLTSNSGAAFFVFLLFQAQVVSFGYLWSFAFSNAKACAALMPLLTIGLFLVPMVLIMQEGGGGADGQAERVSDYCYLQGKSHKLSYMYERGRLVRLKLLVGTGFTEEGGDLGVIAGEGLG
jgi:hypothetical protein